MPALIIVAVLVVFTILWVIAINNKLILLKNIVQNSFSQIDVQLKRRYDLIPNLVEIAKGYLSHERGTLEAVVLARNQAHAISQSLAGNASNTALLGQLAGAEGTLAQSLGKLMAVVESYPDLKANIQMGQLTEELSSTENKISFARQAYNDSVTDYNTAIQIFPNSLIASRGNFPVAAVFGIQNPVEREAVKVSFSK